MNRNELAGLTPVCRRAALGAGQSCVVPGPNGGSVLVVNDGDEILAVDDTCPHAGGPLHEGVVDDGLIICPLHSYSFDLRTGECLEDPSLSVDRYRVVVEDGDIWLQRG